MTKILHGIVRGNAIELTEKIGVADGEEVEVVVRPVKPNAKWGDGIRKSAGGWSDYPEMDEIMKQIQQERKSERRPQGQL